MRRTSRSLFALSITGIAAAGALGCEQRPPPPSEEWLVITSEAAPLIRKYKDDADAQDIGRKGELLKLVTEKREMKWAGKMGDTKAKREGMCLEVKQVEDGQQRFAFLPDLTEKMSVPVTSHLCSEIAGSGSFEVSQCQPALRRARTASGDLAVWIVCNSGVCPVGLWHDGKLSVVGVEGLMGARFYQGKKRSMLLASTRWSKDDGKQSGGAIVPVLFEGATPVLGKEIAVDRVDSRAPEKVIARLVAPTIGDSEVALRGEETVKTADGTTLSTAVIDEKHALPALD